MINIHLSLSISFPEHIVARATLIDNTLILPMVSLLKNKINIIYNDYILISMTCV